jgi:hypothetical protein
MQIQRIQHLIEHPNDVVAEDREGLERWSLKYPYAGVFVMLLARCSAVDGHMNEEKDLLRAASTMSFRQPLFDLIVQAKLVEEAHTVHRALSDDAESFSALAEDVLDAHMVPEKSAETGLNPNEPVEREALISAIERTIETDVSRWEDGKEKSGISPVQPADLALIQDAVSSPFSDWLLQRASEVGFGESASSDLSEPSKAFVSKGDSQEDKMALIDRFIATKPRIGRIREPKTANFWSAESILEDPSLVTETMAHVYAKQGLFDKSRKAYRFLALKYPAKSTYFALQLKKLDDLQRTWRSSNE